MRLSVHDFELLHISFLMSLRSAYLLALCTQKRLCDPYSWMVGLLRGSVVTERRAGFKKFDLVSLNSRWHLITDTSTENNIARNYIITSQSTHSMKRCRQRNLYVHAPCSTTERNLKI